MKRNKYGIKKKLMYGVSKGLGGRDYLRELVRIRDNQTCQNCEKIWQEGERKFHVHHLDSELEGKNGNIYKNNTNFDRMITYCHKCHLNLESVKRKMDLGRVIC